MMQLDQRSLSLNRTWGAVRRTFLILKAFHLSLKEERLTAKLMEDSPMPKD